MAKDSAARIELGRSFHQVGTVNEKVSDSNFVPQQIAVHPYSTLIIHVYLMYIHRNASCTVLQYLFILSINSSSDC